MRRTFLLLALLTVLASTAGIWHYQRIVDAPAPQASIEPAAPTPAVAASQAGLVDGTPAALSPAPAPSPTAIAQVQAPAAEPNVEEVEPAEPDSTPGTAPARRSAGHASGLDKTPDPLGLASSAAMVIDANSRQVVFAKNEEADLPMASLTKLMTGLIILESGLPMTQSITITDDDVDNLLHSRSRLRVGTELTRAEALHLALMSSENRAAHALARTWPQGLSAFIAAMNAKARQLGMTNTVYADPTGLSSRNRASPRDLTALVVGASRYPLLRGFSISPQYLLEEDHRKLRYSNSNRLTRQPNWDIDLQKTGYTIEAGHCVAMRTRIAGRDLVIVLLDAAGSAARWADADRIRYWLDPGAAQADRTWMQQVKKSAKASKAAKPVPARAGTGKRVRKTFG